MHRNKSVNVHNFAMVPRADIPRSGFKIESAYKTTFNSGYLIPVYCEEVLPGDTFNLRATMFARLATPIVPIIDNLYLESFFFFVPNRLVWDNWTKFMGERTTPNASIDYVVPTLEGVNSPAPGSIYDYMGLPINVSSLQVISLPFRAYNLIWNEWFRDENLQSPVWFGTGDGPDSGTNFALKRRGKRHDYFTSCLPWVQKGDSVALPLGEQATVRSNALLAGGNGIPYFDVGGVQTALRSKTSDDDIKTEINTPVDYIRWSSDPVSGTGLYADLSTATAATINQIRQAFQIQKLLERDARGGTRYTELVRSHFGVISPDARLQRPEYLGGGVTPINISPIAQTSGSSVTGSDTPLGTLSAYGTAVAHGHGFTQSFTEHGYVIGLISVRADLNYQQGLNRMWSRQTRYDYYWPVFSHLGEQAVLNKEIYAQGTSVDDEVFGYQERWAEYRYKPSLITGKLRSTFAQPLDVWHLAQKFTALPTLNSTFIEDNPPIDRIVATTEQTGDQFILDCIFRNKAVRPLPMYSVPGLVDHF